MKIDKQGWVDKRVHPDVRPDLRGVVVQETSDRVQVRWQDAGITWERKSDLVLLDL